MGVVQDRWADSRSDVIDPRRCQMFPSLIPYAAARCLEPIRVAAVCRYLSCGVHICEGPLVHACINLCTPSQRLRPFCELAVHDMTIQQPWLDCLVPWVGKCVLDSFCRPLTIAHFPCCIPALNTKLRLIVTKKANNSAFPTLSQLQAGSSLASSQTCCYTISGLLSYAVHQSLSSDHHC